MALPPLATAEDLAEYGYPADAENLLARASARVRRYTGQLITAGTSTVELPGRPYRLLQAPVTAVTSVAAVPDGNALSYRLGAAGVLYVYGCDGPITVEYDHGYEILPDGLIELVCSIAARLASTPEGMLAGARTEQAGGESITWGTDAYSGATGLTSTEKAELDRLFPKLPFTIWLRP